MADEQREPRLVPVDTMFPDPSVVCIGVTARFVCPFCGRWQDITHAWDPDRTPEVTIGCLCGFPPHQEQATALLV